MGVYRVGSSLSDAISAPSGLGMYWGIKVQGKRVREKEGRNVGLGWQRWLGRIVVSAQSESFCCCRYCTALLCFL